MVLSGYVHLQTEIYLRMLLVVFYLSLLRMRMFHFIHMYSAWDMPQSIPRCIFYDMKQSTKLTYHIYLQKDGRRYTHTPTTDTRPARMWEQIVLYTVQDTEYVEFKFHVSHNTYYQQPDRPGKCRLCGRGRHTQRYYVTCDLDYGILNRVCSETFANKDIHHTTLSHCTDFSVYQV